MTHSIFHPAKVRALSLLLVAGVAMPAEAQWDRFSLELGAAHSSNTRIFDRTVTDDAAATASVTRLEVEHGAMESVRIGYAAGGRWMLLADVEYGATHYAYTNATLFFRSTDSRELPYPTKGDATRTALGLTVAYRAALEERPVSIQPEVGLVLYRLKVGQPGEVCVPQPPTLGGSSGYCVTSPQWQQVYRVPSVSGGLSVGYQIGPRMSVEVRGLYAIGRTSTEKGFFVDYPPPLEYLEAPKSAIVHSTQGSVGIRIRP